MIYVNIDFIGLQDGYTMVTANGWFLGCTNHWWNDASIHVCMAGLAGDIPLLVGEIQFVVGWVRMSSPTLDR